MKTCTRCNGTLSSAAKAALSEVCCNCAAEFGDLTAVPIMALTPFRSKEDWHWIIDRYLNNGSFRTEEDWPSIYVNQSPLSPGGEPYTTG